MNTCKTCRHWVHHTDDWKRSWTVCEEADWTARMETLPGTKIAYYADADDDSGLAAGLMTGPDFGCIHWKQK